MARKYVKTFQLNAKLNNADYDLIVSPISKDNKWRELSPFHLGPCTTPRGDTFHNMENLWQFSKVYPQLGHVDSKGNITDTWHKWYDNGCSLKRAQRHPAGKGSKPAFSLYSGRRLSYISARKIIYIPWYARLAQTTEAFHYLDTEYRAGARIAIKDYDCYDHEDLGMTLRDVIESEHKIMGHGFVLAMMLMYGKDFWRRLVI